MHRFALWRGLVFIVISGIFAIAPCTLHAQVTVNHAPLITSQAPTASIAGQTYQYSITATDRDNDKVSFDLTISPDGMTLEGNNVSWRGIKTGTYNAVIEATDKKGGYATQAWQITIAPDAASTIVITPNNKPTTVNLGDNQQFTAKIYDQFSNEVTTENLLAWSTEGNIGSIDNTGLFVATSGGIGSVVAQTTNTKTSIGVVVKDIRSTLVTPATTNTNTNTVAADKDKTTIRPTTNTTTNSNTNESSDPLTNANTNTANEEQQEQKPCTNMPHWIIILMLIIYPIILIVYYKYEKRRPSNGWWLFPFFLTVIGLIIYYKYICVDTYLWWPWILVGLGIILTWWYKAKRRSNDPDSQEKLPF